MSVRSNRPTRVLLVHRYYWPDVPAYAQMLHIMAQRFAQEGYDVSVFTAQPGYNGAYVGKKPPGKETVNGVRIHRIGILRENKKQRVVRAVNILWFCMRLFTHCLIRRYDVMTVASFPPTVMGFMARVICRLRGGVYVYHCQDLYPEVAIASGLATGGPLSRLAAAIDRRNCQRAAVVVVLSADMKQTVANRAISARSVRVINNFVIDRFEGTELPIELRMNPDKFQVVFAGNLGRFQGLEALIEAARLVADESDIEFIFVGGGALTEHLKQQAGSMLGRTIRFQPHQPLQTVMQMIHEANLSVISLSPGVIDCAYPSKTMTYLEAGARLLAIVEDDSELAALVHEHELGSVCPTLEPEAIADVIRSEAAAWRLGAVHDACRIRTLAEELFGQTSTLDQWVATLNEVSPKKFTSTPAPPVDRGQLPSVPAVENLAAQRT